MEEIDFDFDFDEQMRKNEMPSRLLRLKSIRDKQLINHDEFRDFLFQTCKSRMTTDSCEFCNTDVAKKAFDEMTSHSILFHNMKRAIGYCIAVLLSTYQLTCEYEKKWYHKTTFGKIVVDTHSDAIKGAMAIYMHMLKSTMQSLKRNRTTPQTTLDEMYGQAFINVCSQMLISCDFIKIKEELALMQNIQNVISS